MLINETSKITNLTKKAIDYYIEQRLVSPVFLDNGYRDFREEDLEVLKKFLFYGGLDLVWKKLDLF